jgi:electron transport complex protein RnfC
MLKFTPRRTLTGGLRLPAHKLESTAAPIRRGFVPERLFVSARQHRGPAAAPVVEIGQHVGRGETIARSPSDDGADVHAPTSGRVVAIVTLPVPLHAHVSAETCIVIAPDGRDHRSSEPGPIAPGTTPEAAIAQIKAAGIVGLGGAVYPTAAKVHSISGRDCKLLIINGAECEPYISCDDMLMREAPDAILKGAELLRRIVGADECIVAVERDKPQAIDALTASAERLAIEGLRIAELPSVYPAGGERQLVDVLSGIELASARIPAEEGILCQNVGTAYATYHYFSDAEPLTSRIVTITGAAITEPCNVEAMIGTPIRDLIELSGGYCTDAVRLIHGGSMMGYALASDALPITKSTNCIVAATATEVRSDTEEWPCIRCGECSIACPARLLPQDLLLAARAHDSSELTRLSVSECIECGCCDIVCPSHIPLTETFRAAKSSVREREARQALSSESAERFKTREQRRQDALDDADRRRQALKQTLGDEDNRAHEIAAAVARARRKKTTTDTNGA